MKKYIYVIILTVAIVCSSCAGNTFSFNEERQEFVVDQYNFGYFYLDGIIENTSYKLIQKDENKKIKKMKLSRLDDYYIVTIPSHDTLKSLPLEKKSIYKISHTRNGDAAPGTMIIMVDSNYLIHKMDTIIID